MRGETEGGVGPEWTETEPFPAPLEPFLRGSETKPGTPVPDINWSALYGSDRSKWCDVLVDLPPWVKRFRPHQIEAVREAVWNYEQGDQVVVVDAPTGSGKTLIGETVGRLLGGNGLYVCSTKSLQDQVVEDFPELPVLKGRNNYPTQRGEYGGKLGITAADCTKSRDEGRRSCDWCWQVSECPYERAKARSLRSRSCVLNTSYFLTEANGPGRFSGRDWVIADEADLLERELMGFVGVEVSPRRVKELGLGEPGKVTKESSWLEWCERSADRISRAIAGFGSGELDIHEFRRWKFLDQLRSKLTTVARGIEGGGWIYTGKLGAVSFKPVKVDRLASQHLWRHSKRWLLMSATIISPDELLESLGYDGQWNFISVRSTFPSSQRQVVVRPTANMVFKPEVKKRPGLNTPITLSALGSKTDGVISNVSAEMSAKFEEWGKLADELGRIVQENRGENCLVHTVSYELSRYLGEALQRDDPTVSIISYNDGNGRADALDRIRRCGRGDRGHVIIAPSFDRGIDLADDLCRVIVIAKVPYPYLGDRQVSARLNGGGRAGQIWYNVQTVRSIVQMTGRGMRHQEDYCTSYILDKQFLSLWGKARKLFPEWWSEGLVWTEQHRG